MAGPARQQLAEAFRALAHDLLENHSFSADELRRLIAPTGPTIPAETFDTALTPLETLARWTADDPERQALLGRPAQTLRTACENADRKHPGPLPEGGPRYAVPLSAFGTSGLSALETLCVHLREEHDLSNARIARLIGKDPRVVWTVLKRADEKRETGGGRRG